MRPLKLFIGSGFGSGYFPFAPGTAGSLLATIIMYFILQLDVIIGTLIFVIISSVLTLWVSSVCEEEWGKDPGKEVIDEFAGQALVFITIPIYGELVYDIILLSAGFILFRIFDIWKPLGINKVQKMGGGIGILLDDLIAGFYAFICLKTLIFLSSKFLELA
ncbi:MAG: phosphatidylglycerophosphatase A [Balneolaceae bacterium]